MDNQKLKQIIKSRLEEYKDITNFFTLKTTVKARYFFRAKSRFDLKLAFHIANQLQLPLLLIGGGSNYALTQEQLNYLVVKNEHCLLDVLSETENQIKIMVGSGYPVARLVNLAITNGWEGFEYHSGLPGTVGGAIYMNSKWTKPLDYFGDHLDSAFILDNLAKIKLVKRDYFHFDYDYSILQKTKEILLEGIFILKKNNSAILKQRAEQALRYRRRTQPIGQLTSGCFFRNIDQKTMIDHHLPTTSAGYLIEKAGLKGLRVGRFVVSPKHANFIINLGGGTGTELKTIIRQVKEIINNKYGINLKEEVILI